MNKPWEDQVTKTLATFLGKQVTAGGLTGKLKYRFGSLSGTLFRVVSNEKEFSFCPGEISEVVVATGGGKITCTVVLNQFF